MAAKGSTAEMIAIKKNMGLIGTVFSWSLEDIFNDNLYKDLVGLLCPPSSSSSLNL